MVLKLRRFQYYSSGQNDSKGCGIFFLFVIFLPIIGIITALIEFVKNHALSIGAILVLSMFIVFYMMDKGNSKEDEEWKN